MTTREIRQDNLRKWLANNSTPEKEKSYFSQLLSGAASFGERAARRLEREYRMGDGYLDSQPQTSKMAISVSVDSVDIPILDVAGSMGNGYSQPETDALVERMTVTGAWIRRNVNVSRPDCLAIISAYGDSMEGTFNDGDIETEEEMISKKLSPRVVKLLLGAGISTPAEIVAKYPIGLLSIHGFGYKALREVEDAFLPGERFSGRRPIESFPDC